MAPNGITRFQDGFEMTNKEFRRIAFKLFGPQPGWQSRCAEALHVDKSSVSKWISSTHRIPGPVIAALELLRKQR